MPLPIAAGIVGVILAALSRLIMSRAGTWIAGVLLTLGLSIGAYTGTQLLLESRLEDVLNIAEANTVGDFAVWLAFFNVDKAITMIVSAIVVAAGIKAGKSVFLRRR